MEPHINALGTFGLDIFAHHFIRRSIVCLNWRLVLLVVYLLKNLSRVHGFPCVEE